jgi:hypothetical protein
MRQDSSSSSSSSSVSHTLTSRLTAFHELLNDTSLRDRFAGLSQSAFRLAMGLVLLLRPERKELIGVLRRLMLAVSDARRNMRCLAIIGPLLALHARIGALIKDHNHGLSVQETKNRTGESGVQRHARAPAVLSAFESGCAVLGLAYDHLCWLHQHGVLRGSHVPAAVSADWWSALTLACSLAKRAAGGLSELRDSARAALKELMLFLVVAHGGAILTTNDAFVGLLGCLAHGSAIQARLEERRAPRVLGAGEHAHAHRPQSKEL